MTFTTLQERFCGVVFSHGAAKSGRREGKERGEGGDGHRKVDVARDGGWFARVTDGEEG